MDAKKERRVISLRPVFFRPLPPIERAVNLTAVDVLDIILELHESGIPDIATYNWWVDIYNIKRGEVCLNHA